MPPQVRHAGREAAARPQTAIAHVSRGAHRQHRGDCERTTSDEKILELRRGELDVSSGLEYEIFGKFKMTEEGGHGFPDTYWFSVEELREAGARHAELGKREPNRP